MSQSANTREARRLATERRIVACAQELTLEHGLDGFTMDDLAEAAEVSRRTLFNYFPSKIDAVLGGVPQQDDEGVEVFRAGGPTGRLMDDVVHVALRLITDDDLGRAELERGQRVVASDPKLLAAAHERFELMVGEYVDVILAREGEDFGRSRAQLLIRLVVAIFDSCLPSPLHGARTDAEQAADDRPFEAVFTEQIAAARELFA
ncbi:TetR/AcrR family transcriptional regulator [Nocardioides nanhaiensis]|uniref:HTH tetR-type domain-containing protein n=1 Tax=Nocardioides nanhaiensis TaxID=1476871 RepID=A0ABP8WDY2_9ACTN